MGGQPKCKLLAWEKNQPWRNGKFCANFGSNDVWIMWWERGRLLAEEGDRKHTWCKRREDKPYGSSCTRSCIEATNPLLLVAGTEIHCWGSRKQQWMELVVEDLIKGRWYTPTWKQNTQWICADSWQSVVRDLADLTWGSYRKGLAPDSEITKSAHICCFNKLKLRLT